jgi:hypothetical protein
MAQDTIRLTLHLELPRREARDLWLQLSKHFSEEEQLQVNLAKTCANCGGFKRGWRAKSKDVLCFRCSLEDGVPLAQVLARMAV